MSRSRIGVIVASANTTIEYEFQRLAGSDASIHAARIAHRKLSQETVTKMREDAVSAAHLLAHAGVDCIVYGITAGSFLLGPDHDPILVKEIESATGARAITVLEAVIWRLKQLRAKRFALATPYPDAVTEREAAFFREAGYGVTRSAGLGYSDVAEIGNLAPSTAAKVVEKVAGGDADAIFLSCTNWHTLPVLGELRKGLEMEVFSSNSAAFSLAREIAGF